MKKATKFFVIPMLVVLCSFKNANTGWKTIYSENGIEISYKLDDCNLEQGFKQRWYLVRVKNNSAKIKKVEWDVNSYNENNKCTTCDGSAEHHRVLKIDANGTLEGSCTLQCRNELKIVAKLLDAASKSEVTDLKLVNITVTDISGK